MKRHSSLSKNKSVKEISTICMTNLSTKKGRSINIRDNWCMSASATCIRSYHKCHEPYASCIYVTHICICIFYHLYWSPHLKTEIIWSHHYIEYGMAKLILLTTPLIACKLRHNLIIIVVCHPVSQCRNTTLCPIGCKKLEEQHINPSRSIS